MGGWESDAGACRCARSRRRRSATANRPGSSPTTRAVAVGPFDVHLHVGRRLPASLASGRRRRPPPRAGAEEAALAVAGGDRDREDAELARPRHIDRDPRSVELPDVEHEPAGAHFAARWRLVQMTR